MLTQIPNGGLKAINPEDPMHGGQNQLEKKKLKMKKSTKLQIISKKIIQS